MLVRIQSGERQTLFHMTATPRGRARTARLAWLLTVVTILFAAWALWRYGIADATIARLPGWLGDLLGLLTGAGFLTLCVLWGIVAWQFRQRSALTRSLETVDLYALSPRDFEHFVAQLFERRGYHVEVRGRSGDLGVDLSLTGANGRRAIVQCKRYRHQVGPDIVRELFGTMVHERALHGFLVTTAEISDAAREWARGKPITLIDGQTLVQLANDRQARS